MSNYYVWAALDAARDNYRAGDLVPDNAGAYLYAGDTLDGARAAMVSDPATYETGDGRPARLYVAAGDAGTAPRIVSNPAATV